MREKRAKQLAGYPALAGGDLRGTRSAADDAGQREHGEGRRSAGQIFQFYTSNEGAPGGGDSPRFRPS